MYFKSYLLDTMYFTIYLLDTMKKTPHLLMRCFRGTDGDRTHDLPHVKRTLIPAELRFRICLATELIIL